MFNKDSSGAIRDHACSMDRLTEHLEKEFEWRKAHSDFATKHDLCETECRIIAAIKAVSGGGGGDAPAIEKATADLKASSDPLAAAVEHGQPKTG